MISWGLIDWLILEMIDVSSRWLMSIEDSFDRWLMSSWDWFLIWKIPNFKHVHRSIWLPFSRQNPRFLASERWLGVQKLPQQIHVKVSFTLPSKRVPTLQHFNGFQIDWITWKVWLTSVSPIASDLIFVLVGTTLPINWLIENDIDLDQNGTVLHVLYRPQKFTWTLALTSW